LGVRVPPDDRPCEERTAPHWAIGN
jgi:hypothetical protein